MDEQRKISLEEDCAMDDMMCDCSLNQKIKEGNSVVEPWWPMREKKYTACPAAPRRAAPEAVC
jgi:hypothetical protein